MVVNYDYERLLGLMESNIEVSTERLASYVKGHDADITDAQAHYLADCSMEMLCTVGKAVIHQVAAGGFSAGRAAVGRQATKVAAQGTARATQAAKGANAAKGIAKAAKSIQDTPKATQVAKMLRSKEVGLLPQFSSIESVIQGAGKLHRGKNGVRIGSITGNAENIFRYLAHQYNAKIQTGQTGQKYFEFGHTRIDLTGSSNGLPTLRINQNDKLLKIRVIQ